MKTKEFIRKIEELGFKMRTSDYIDGKKYFIVYRKDNCFTIAHACENYKNVFDTNVADFCELPQEKQNALFNLLVEYASTPLEEREEEKVYQFKFVNFGDDWNYLVKSRKDGKFYMDNKVQVSVYQTEFIDSEIDEFPAWIHEMLGQGHLIKEKVE